ncbi:hypothetical protein BDC45DRAFT_536495 [Circinella umbellata]|nr:hypothetical protein BDC45DRAFT_536495 [Circinella umbellata]
MDGNNRTTSSDNSVSPSTQTSSLAAAIVAATLAATSSQNKQHLQFCVNDLLHSSDKAESLLESLTTEQLNIIEKTLNKIREKKAPVTPPQPQPQEEWNNAASQVAKVLADAISAVETDTTITVTNNSNSIKLQGKGTEASSLLPPPSSSSSSSSLPPSKTTTTSTNENNTNGTVSHHEPVTENRDGVEWVSFVYSHHRILRRYCIRTDLDKVDISQLDEKFKRDNCVYPRANLPRETYRGNRWAYETECNVLGWKLASLNANEIAGKRGLIQRAVDSYRNRYPSMRSRRVARQEKLLNGTLRKRKHRESENDHEEPADKMLKSTSLSSNNNNSMERYLPKTISIDDGPQGNKCRIRINIETVPLDVIDAPFRRSNCVFPRAINITSTTPSVSQRQLDEAKCNELGWKLAWLNPRQLANRKSLLQRVLDIYRIKFASHLRPRKYASRMPPAPFAPPPRSEQPLKLTAETLAAQQQQLAAQEKRQQRRKEEDDESIYSGTTVSLDFRDCFSPPPEVADDPTFFKDIPTSPLPSQQQQQPPQPPQQSSSSTVLLSDYAIDSLMLPASRGDLMLCQGNDSQDVVAVAAAAAAAAAASAQQEYCADDMSCHLSVETSSSGTSSSNPSNHSSPRHQPTMIGIVDNDLYNATEFLMDGMSLFGQQESANDELLKRYIDEHDIFSPCDPHSLGTGSMSMDDDIVLGYDLSTNSLLNQLF